MAKSGCLNRKTNLPNGYKFLYQVTECRVPVDAIDGTNCLNRGMEDDCEERRIKPVGVASLTGLILRGKLAKGGEYYNTVRT